MENIICKICTHSDDSNAENVACCNCCDGYCNFHADNEAIISRFSEEK